MSESVARFREAQKGEKMRYFRNLWSCSGDVLDRLRNCPMSFRNAVMNWAEYCRLALDILSFMDFYNNYLPRLEISGDDIPPANPNLRGTYSHDINAVTHCARLGIPVWHIRTDAQIPFEVVIRKVISEWIPMPSIATDWGEEHGGPGPILHTGQANAQSQFILARFGACIYDEYGMSSNDISYKPRHVVNSSAFITRSPNSSLCATRSHDTSGHDRGHRDLGERVQVPLVTPWDRRPHSGKQCYSI